MRQRSFPPIVLLGTLLAAVVLAGCGSRGYGPSLGEPAHATLAVSGMTQAAAHATLTPISAMRIAVYYQGQAVPTSGARTPAELRQGSCTGPVVAPLTDGLPASAVTAKAPAVTQPAPAGGTFVALPPGAQWYVVVLARANDPTAPIVACGNPLSERRQYFDLYQADVGSNGIALGTALVDPIVATRMSLSFTSAPPPTAPVTWAIRSEGCEGAEVASGTIQTGRQEGNDIIFSAPDTEHWWVTATPAGGRTVCGRVGA